MRSFYKNTNKISYKEFNYERRIKSGEWQIKKLLNYLSDFGKIYTRCAQGAFKFWISMILFCDGLLKFHA